MAKAQRQGWALVALDCAVDTTTPAREGWPTSSRPRDLRREDGAATGRLLRGGAPPSPGEAITSAGPGSAPATAKVAGLDGREFVAQPKRVDTRLPEI